LECSIDRQGEGGAPRELTLGLVSGQMSRENVVQIHLGSDG
jgi:hypothetical protein